MVLHQTAAKIYHKVMLTAMHSDQWMNRGNHVRKHIDIQVGKSGFAVDRHFHTPA